MISLTFDPLTPWPLTFLISKFSSILPFQQPLIHLILFRTHPVTHLSLFDDLSYADALPYTTLCQTCPMLDLPYASNLPYATLH